MNRKKELFFEIKGSNNAWCATSKINNKIGYGKNKKVGDSRLFFIRIIHTVTDVSSHEYFEFIWHAEYQGISVSGSSKENTTKRLLEVLYPNIIN